MITGVESSALIVAFLHAGLFAKIMRREEARAFGAWVTFAGDKQRKRCDALVAVQHWRCRELSQAFTYWRYLRIVLFAMLGLFNYNCHNCQCVSKNCYDNKELHTNYAQNSMDIGNVAVRPALTCAHVFERGGRGDLGRPNIPELSSLVPSGVLMLSASIFQK